MPYYYYKVYEGIDVIKQLGVKYNGKIPKNSTEITKDEYENYLAIIRSVPQKEGYTAKMTLHVDGTYEVEYIEIVPDEDEEE